MATRQRKERRFLKAAGVMAVGALIALTPWICNKWEKYKNASEQKPKVQQVTRENCAQFIPEVPEERCKEGRACFDEPKKNDDKCETNKGEEIEDGKYYDPLGCYCGNNTCDTSIGEDSDTCAKDCHCGDKKCEEGKGETKKTCPEDCDKKPASTVVTATRCTSNEDCRRNQECKRGRCRRKRRPTGEPGSVTAPGDGQQGTSTAKCDPGKVRLFKEHQVGQHATKAYLGINQVRNKKAINGEMINGKTVSAVVTHCTDRTVIVSNLSIPGAPADLIRKVKASIVSWVSKVPPENYDIKFKISLTVRD